MIITYCYKSFVSELKKNYLSKCLHKLVHLDLLLIKACTNKINKNVVVTIATVWSSGVKFYKRATYLSRYLLFCADILLLLI